MPAPFRLIIATVVLAAAGALRAAPSDDVQRLLLAGKYADSVARAKGAIGEAPEDEDLRILLVQGLLATGRYPEALAEANAATARLPESIRVRWAAREAAMANGDADGAAKLLGEMRQFVANRPGLYRDPADLVTFGRVALLFGADPKDVLDKILATALGRDPSLRDACLAKGELALGKHDFDLAAKAYQAGLKVRPDDPDFHCGLARAFAPSDREAMLAEAQAALKANPRHAPSLLLLADHDIDAEDYDGADKLLDQVLAVDPWRPEAWAYRSLLAQLRNDPAGAAQLRTKALRFAPANPLVDWLIGRKLAQKYRFAEAAGFERQALKFDPSYLPAMEELASDLLRTGQEDEGWQLAAQVHSKDEYDVEAYNLTTLHDTMAKYARLDDGDFSLFMTPHEAAVYGRRALDLLERARRVLTEKYGVDLVRPTYVEIFGDQKDFAVRTFGVPDIGGFLGVCFGRVVTANGPAANTSQQANWETVLWHEFCHVVTLQLTRNRMPRWLSEGISVYEEGRADPSWGMHMTPGYRERIVNGGLTPVSRLSGAFLTPPTAEDLQFAYFESSLVVDYIVKRYGIEGLKAILRDIGSGAEANKAVAGHTAPMDELEKGFRAYAREKAEGLAPKLAWDEPDAGLMMPGREQDLMDWARLHPDNYRALRIQSRELVEAKKWEEARVVLRHFLDLYPSQTGGDGAYAELASVERALGNPAGEREALEKLAALDDNATDACLRLTDIARAAGDWAAERRYAERFIAVNPLVAPPYVRLAEADRHLDDAPAAMAADRALLLVGAPNPADVHFDLARLLHRENDPEARRQVLQALEDAPRYREALTLLQDINRSTH